MLVLDRGYGQLDEADAAPRTINGRKVRALS
jgi:hypothetical protein